jgi:hypothetical protein
MSIGAGDFTFISFELETPADINFLLNIRWTLAGVVEATDLYHEKR